MTARWERGLELLAVLGTTAWVLYGPHTVETLLKGIFLLVALLYLRLFHSEQAAKKETNAEQKRREEQEAQDWLDLWNAAPESLREEIRERWRRIGTPSVPGRSSLQ